MLTQLKSAIKLAVQSKEIFITKYKIYQLIDIVQIDL